MFIPSYQALTKALGCSRLDPGKSSDVKIPFALLRLLLERQLERLEFDEHAYLALNPDVARAVAKGSVRSARHHYAAFGYWESRPGATSAVDEVWYVKTYRDVAAAIKSGSVVSGAQHYIEHGWAEFRAPNPASMEDCLRWQAIFGGSAASAPKSAARRKSATKPLPKSKASSEVKPKPPSKQKPKKRSRSRRSLLKPSATTP